MQGREVLTDGNILSDLLEAEILRHKKATEGHKFRIGSFLVYAIAVGILSKIFWVGLIIALGSVYHAVMLSRKIREHKSNMASLRSGGFTVDTDIFSHSICDFPPNFFGKLLVFGQYHPRLWRMVRCGRQCGENNLFR